MLPSIFGARLSWHFANGWVYEPAIVRPETRHGARRADPSPTLKIFWSNDPKLIGFIEPRLSAQPWRTLQQPIQLAGFQARIPLTYVACTSYGNTPFTERLAEMGLARTSGQPLSLPITSVCSARQMKPSKC